MKTRIILTLAAIGAIAASVLYATPPATPTPVPYPASRYPYSQDGEIGNLQKILAIASDAKNGAIQIHTTAAPSYSNVISVTCTNAAYVAIASTPAISATLVNTTGKSVGLKINGSTVPITIVTGGTFTIRGITNLSAITATDITDATSIAPTFYYEVQ